MKEPDLTSLAGAAIVRWNKSGMTCDFPTAEVEKALAFCRGDVEHRKIAVQHIAIHSTYGCNRDEMAIVKHRLNAIAVNPPAQSNNPFKRKVSR